MPDRPTPAAPSRASVTIPSKRTVGGTLTGAALAALALAIASIKPGEGKENRAYLDLAGIPTVCFGHTGADVGPIGLARTDAQCDVLLQADALRTERAVLACVPGLDSRPQQLAAATSLAFNIGATAFCRSGSASAFRRNDWRKGCDLMLAWDKATVGGRLVRVDGLSARRRRERLMCLTDVRT